MFYDLQNMQSVCSIVDRIERYGWDHFDFDAYLYDYCLPPASLHLQRTVCANILPLPPGTRFNETESCIEQVLYRPVITDKTSLSDYLELSSDFFESLNAKKIGVHLSGGFDSSLIMATMLRLGIPFVAVGLQGETYEFRNERKIQDIYLNKADAGVMLSLEDYPFYGDFYNVPFTEFPPENIKSIASARAMAHEFSKLGCDVILSGQGGDSVFVDDMRWMDSVNFNITNEFANDNETLTIYDEAGLRLLSFYENTQLIDFVATVRAREKEDPLKLFARRFFRDILPAELSDFSYVSDYFGYSKYGLHLARAESQKVVDEAFRITGCEFFNRPGFSSADIFGFEYDQYLHYCGVLSVAVWVRNVNNLWQK